MIVRGNSKQGSTDEPKRNLKAVEYTEDRYVLSWKSEPLPTLSKYDREYGVVSSLYGVFV